MKRKVEINCPEGCIGGSFKVGDVECADMVQGFFIRGEAGKKLIIEITLAQLSLLNLKAIPSELQVNLSNEDRTLLERFIQEKEKQDA